MNDNFLEIKTALLLDSISDAIDNIFFHDRKDDEELTVDDIDEIMQTSNIKTRIIEHFKKEINAL